MPASPEGGRRRPFAVVGVLIVLLLLALPAQALTDRARFEKWCSQGSSVASARCLSYLLAAEDVLSIDSIEGVRACLPRDITLQEQYRIVREWLAAHPEVEAQTAMGLVAQAYATNFPCRP